MFLLRSKKNIFELSLETVSQFPEIEKEESKERDESKNVQTTFTRSNCKRSRPVSYYHPNCSTPRHWKFT